MASEPLRLSPAELAVVFQHLIGRDADTQRAFVADVDIDQAQLEAARRTLIERGLLMGDPRRSETALSPALEPILRTVTAPEALGILQVSKPGAPPKAIYISWTQTLVVANWIDETGEHVIEPLASLKKMGEAVVGWTGIGDFRAAKKAEGVDPESIVQNATQRAVFLAVAGVQQDEQGSQAVSWITSGDRLWLMDGQGGGEQPVVRPTGAAEVRKLVQSLMAAATAGGAAAARSSN